MAGEDAVGVDAGGVLPKNHPVRQIKPLADSALGRMSPLFDEIYATTGGPRFRPSTCSSRAC